MRKKWRYGVIGMLAAGAMALSACSPAPAQPVSSPASGQEAPDYSVRKTPSVKKGIGSSRYGPNGATQAQLSKLTDLGVGWYYNWGIANPNPRVDLEFVPMIWGAGQMTESMLNLIKENYEKGVYRALLTFNEPDLPEQSNMTVETALELWPRLEALGIPLGSPCPAVYENGWLDRFMAGAQEKGYRVDFITLHNYQDFSSPTAVAALKTQLTGIYEKYGLPVWLTEFGAIDVSTWTGGKNPNCTEQAALTYIDESTAMLESLGFVERYAWFLDNFSEYGASRPTEAPYTSLYTDEDELSSTGKAYRDRVSGYGLSLSPEKLPTCTVGKAYTAAMTAQGGKTPYTFSADGLPKGLRIDPSSGVISGTPSDTGRYQATVTVTDAHGQSTFRRLTLADSSQFKLEPLSKKGWKGNCAYFNLKGDFTFENNDAPQLVDGNTQTAYKMNRPMTTYDVFQALFADYAEIKKIVFRSPKGQQAPAVKVQYCNKAGVWGDCPIESQTLGETSEIVFKNILTANGILIQLTDDDASRTWAMSEIDVYGFVY